MSSTSSISVAGLQLDYPAGESRAARIERVLRSVESGPAADLVVLPELWDVAYFAFDDYTAAAEPIESGPAARLVDVAAERSSTIVGTVLERDDDRLYNTAVAVGPHGIVGTYRKQHLFRYGSREGELLSPGTGAAVVATPVGVLGLATCFDLRFPEHFTALREQGADVLVVPAAWPRARIAHWRVLVQARAIEGQTPVVAVNGTGRCIDVELGGESMIVDARGATTADPGTTVGWFTADIDHADTRAWRAEFPLREATRG